MTNWEQIVCAAIVIIALGMILDELKGIRKILARDEASSEKTNDLLAQIESHASDLVQYEKKRFQPPLEY